MRASLVPYIFQPHGIEPVQGPERALRIPPFPGMAGKLVDFFGGNGGHSG
jgi:hypothetical protein